MSRNYEKEAAWQKEKYTRLSAFVDKELADALKSALKREGIPYAQWLKEQAERYLKERG